MSETVFETGTSLTKKIEQERKRSQNVYASMLRVLSYVLLSGKVKVFLDVEMTRERERERVRERERAVSGSQNVREFISMLFTHGRHEALKFCGGEGAVML